MKADKKSARFPRPFTYLCLSVFICGYSFIACDRQPAGQSKEIILYTSVDEPIARPIIDAFTAQTGIRVALVTDTEASKSVGLAERLRAEKNRPRANVWWGNEPFHTILLAEEGLFAQYESSSAADVPGMYKDPQHRWAGNGLRARILMYKFPGAIAASQARLEYLADAPAAMARPTAGTTGGHVASLYAVWGDERADEFFRSLANSGIKLLGGNGPVARAVANGEFSVGLTDNDDYGNLRDHPGTIRMALPNQDDIGTLMIPTTVALVAGPPESAEAKRLVDYLLSHEVERKLIDAKFAGWSIRGGPDQPKAMQIDYVEVARKMPQAVRRATAILEGRQ
jgi:iron(III) transport system substrate-binding protein